jgi:hypothetical protein
MQLNQITRIPFVITSHTSPEINALVQFLFPPTLRGSVVKIIAATNVLESSIAIANAVCIIATGAAKVG